MSVRSKAQRVLTLFLALALVICWVPALVVPVSAVSADNVYYGNASSMRVAYMETKDSDVLSWYGDGQTEKYIPAWYTSTVFCRIADSYSSDVNLVPINEDFSFYCGFDIVQGGSETLSLVSKASSGTDSIIFRLAVICYDSGFNQIGYKVFDKELSSSGSQTIMSDMITFSDLFPSTTYVKIDWGMGQFVVQDRISGVYPPMKYWCYMKARYHTFTSFHSLHTGNEEPAAVTSVDISRTPSWCYLGSSIEVAVDVTGTGDFDPSCTCIVSGGTSDGTYISQDTSTDTPNIFNLHVGADETASTLTVTVASVSNPEIRTWKTIELDSQGTSTTEPDATTPEDETTVPGDDPTTPDVTTPPAEEPDKDDFIGEGESILDDLDDVIPDYTDEFSVVIKEFADSMSYEGTDCKFAFPAITIPAVPGVMDAIPLNEEKEVDFADFFALFPPDVFNLVQLLLTAALIIYCVKELYGMVQYVLTMKGGGS